MNITNPNAFRPANNEVRYFAQFKVKILPTQKVKNFTKFHFRKNS